MLCHAFLPVSVALFIRPRSFPHAASPPPQGSP
jgi:hypothetical protein